jgi:hypothetical protein
MVLCRQRETAMWVMLFADDGIHLLFAYDLEAGSTQEKCRIVITIMTPVSILCRSWKESFEPLNTFFLVIVVFVKLVGPQCTMISAEAKATVMMEGGCCC